MRLTRREFHTLMREALREMPAKVEDALENVAVLVQDWPRPSDLETAGVADRSGLFGLYTGVPLAEREGGLPPLPDTITLFQRPIELACRSHEEVVREIKVTLRHEIGHYLGMSEEDLDRLGYG